MSARDVADFYIGLDLDALPLHANSKRPIAGAWQHTPISEQWRNATDDVNIGLRAGGASRLACFDCDDWKLGDTSANVTRYLAGMGIDAGDCPIVQSVGHGDASGKRFYVRLVGPALAGNKRTLSPEVGAGEFQHGSGAQSVVPCSTIDGRAYQNIAGDWRQLPSVELRDLTPLLSNQDATPAPTVATIATPSNARYTSQFAWRILTGKAHYADKSAGEAALIASLIRTGHDLNSILDLFSRWPCLGKWQSEMQRGHKQGMYWLRRTFEREHAYISTHGASHSRLKAQAMIEWAEARRWSGRTGAVDRAVFIAHARRAYDAGRLTYALSSRDIAEAAGVTRKTATYRLMRADLLTREKEWIATLANVYRLKVDTAQLTPLRSSINVTKWGKLRQDTHDAFRTRNGKTRREVWGALQNDEALTIAELAERALCHRDTIARALSRMAHIVDMATGEVISMVECDGDKWRAVSDVDLDAIARALGTAGASEKQKRQHAEERQKHRKKLEEGKDKVKK